MCAHILIYALFCVLLCTDVRTGGATLYSVHLFMQSQPVDLPCPEYSLFKKVVITNLVRSPVLNQGLKKMYSSDLVIYFELLKIF